MKAEIKPDGTTEIYFDRPTKVTISTIVVGEIKSGDIAFEPFERDYDKLCCGGGAMIDDVIIGRLNESRD